MPGRRNLILLCGVLLAAICCVVQGQEEVASQKVQGSVDSAKRLTLETARDRATVLHDSFLITMQIMHDRYFHADRAIVPARAMEDVFDGVEEKYGIRSRWISASLKAMSINHDPVSEFEKQAARRLAKGEDVVEVIEEGYYRRAGSVPLTGGCLSCHAGFFSGQSHSKKFAGLIISVPVQDGVTLPETVPEATSAP